jgi:hypothetical protein
LDSGSFLNSYLYLITVTIAAEEKIEGTPANKLRQAIELLQSFQVDMFKEVSTPVYLIIQLDIIISSFNVTAETFTCKICKLTN